MEQNLFAPEDSKMLECVRCTLFPHKSLHFHFNLRFCLHFLASFVKAIQLLMLRRIFSAGFLLHIPAYLISNKIIKKTCNGDDRYVVQCRQLQCRLCSLQFSSTSGERKILLLLHIRIESPCMLCLGARRKYKVPVELRLYRREASIQFKMQAKL